MSDDLVPLDRSPEPAPDVIRGQAYETRMQRRADIVAFEAALAQHPQAVVGDSEAFPLVHRFADGLYIREIFITKGSLITGKIHRDAHPVFLMQGRIRVFTEQGGTQDLEAPLVFLAPPGVKRAALALETTVWVTVHHNPTNTTDLAALEALITVPSYAALEAEHYRSEDCK